LKDGIYRTNLCAEEEIKETYEEAFCMFPRKDFAGEFQSIKII
jgi:hypothetical protein